MNGTRTVTQTFNAANQVNGFTYDAAGNLTNDGTTTYGYDALSRMIGSGGTTYTYNGDGALVDDGTTRYTQDLASPLSQVLQTTQGSTTTDYLYGRDRLALVAGSTRTWYGADALGSVRQTISDVGLPLSVVNYDPWGTVEGGSVPVLGFTGEVQDAATGLVNLRARWYSAAKGTFTSVDPFAGSPQQPSSLHPYQYGYSDPVLHTDPSGQLPCDDDGDCPGRPRPPTPPTPPTPPAPPIPPTPCPTPTPTPTPTPGSPDFSTMGGFQFIEWILPLARESRRISGVPTAVTIGQAMVEAGIGAGDGYHYHEPIDINDGRHSYNLFGIKGNWACRERSRLQ